MPGRLGFKMGDYSREESSFSIATGEVTAVSLPGLLDEVGDLRTAVEGITAGVVWNESLSVFNTNLSNTPAASPLAQVESVWTVFYEDDLPFFDDPVNAIPNEGFGKIFKLTIPTADLSVSGILQTNSDHANMANSAIVAFVTAFETTARSPYGGTVNVTDIVFTGRNS